MKRMPYSFQNLPSLSDDNQKFYNNAPNAESRSLDGSVSLLM